MSKNKFKKMKLDLIQNEKVIESWFVDYFTEAFDIIVSSKLTGNFYMDNQKVHTYSYEKETDSLILIR